MLNFTQNYNLFVSTFLKTKLNVFKINPFYNSACKYGLFGTYINKCIFYAFWRPFSHGTIFHPSPFILKTH